MESSGMYSGLGSGMIGLEMSLHHHIPPQQNPSLIQPNPNQSMVPFDQHPSVKQVGVHPYCNKPKTQGFTLSDDDEPAGGPTADQNSAEDGKRKMSPWQRMKWTDEMVRLLIMVVYYIGDEGGASEGNNEKKGGHGGVLQKKGKWKSVSRAMMERGFYVSPQQCEDKFNDLNKRYKRVNDILGKGTACRVVENQSLLETMDLSPKMKEEAKKLLNSKHLFFREMCAYHNSCSHGTSVTEGSSEPSPQQKCLHSSDGPRIGPNNSGRAETEGTRTVKETGEEDDDESNDEDEDEDDDDDGFDEEEDNNSRKRQRIGVMVQQLGAEVASLCQDGSRSHLEKKHWIRARMMQLEEHRVMYESQRLDLQKQRLQWEKFSSKKEREMEREKLRNERKRLENDRMVLLLQQKELELLDHLHHQQRTSDPSSVTG